jgi:hypothetical protein
VSYRSLSCRSVRRRPPRPALPASCSWLRKAPAGGASCSRPKRVFDVQDSATRAAGVLGRLTGISPGDLELTRNSLEAGSGSSRWGDQFCSFQRSAQYRRLTRFYPAIFSRFILGLAGAPRLKVHTHLPVRKSLFAPPQLLISSPAELQGELISSRNRRRVIARSGGARVLDNCGQSSGLCWGGEARGGGAWSQRSSAAFHGPLVGPKPKSSGSSGRSRGLRTWKPVCSTTWR